MHINTVPFCKCNKCFRKMQSHTYLTTTCYLLNKKVPKRQEYMWSSIVIRKWSLNSNALGNCVVIW
jgi:hypothetical protein